MAEQRVGVNEGSYENPYKFNGKELDVETGYYYYGARYYDPRISNFLSVDPLAEKTRTPYAYCYNNPINLIDPTGMAPDWHHDGQGNIVADKNDNIESLASYLNITLESAKQKLNEQNIKSISAGTKLRIEGKTIMLFVNGNIGGGSGPAGKGYWNKDFVDKGLSYWYNSEARYTATDYDDGSQASERWYKGLTADVSSITEGLYPSLDLFVVVSHSMGAAYSEGIMSTLKNRGYDVAQAIHIAPYQAEDINSQIKNHNNGNYTFTYDVQFNGDPVLWLDGPTQEKLNGADMHIRTDINSNLPMNYKHGSLNPELWDEIY